MDKVKQYWAAFTGRIIAHPVSVGIIIIALVIAVIIFMVT